jgi:hypothetical protein
VLVEGADGVERTQVRTATRKLETLFGTVEVERQLYQAPGAEGLAPLDAALALPDEKYPMELRRLVAEESPRASFDEVVELIENGCGSFGTETNRSDVDRLARGTVARRALCWRGARTRPGDVRPTTKRPTS